jgi:alpha-tubulin suppressor-like RCC1 family protein
LGDDDADSYIPVQITNLTEIVAISTSFNHNLVLRRDGTVWSWGWNFTGQLGHSYTEKEDFYDCAPPEQVPGLEGVIAVSTGGSHSLALRRDGTVWSWGNNGFGQLGN